MEPLDVLHSLCATLQRQDLQAQVNAVADGLPFLRLPHPRTGFPTLFLLSNNTISEVQAVTPFDPRSWFIEEDVVADGKLVLITPVDPAFLLIPILQAAHPQDGTLGSFRPADDIFEEASRKFQASLQSGETDSSVLSKDILRFASLKMVKESLKRICDVKEITEEIIVYRLSLQKIVAYFRVKAARLAIPEVLEVSRTSIRGLAKDGLLEDGKEELLQMGRIRAACDLLAQYLSATTRAALFASYDFTKLDEYLKHVEAEANVATGTVKHGKDKKVVTTGDNKKRKTTKGSQGVEKLKKVNVNGMAKLSSFFNKS